MISDIIALKSSFGRTENEEFNIVLLLTSKQFKMKKLKRKLRKSQKRLNELNIKIKQKEMTSWESILVWIKVRIEFNCKKIEGILKNLSSDEERENSEESFIRNKMSNLERLKFSIDDIILVRHTEKEKDESLVKSIYNLLKNKFPVRAEILLSEVTKVDALLKEKEASKCIKLDLKRKLIALKDECMRLKQRLRQS